jgi:hypothetical protein
LEIVLILRQDRCMVCAERTIASKIILEAPMVLLGDEAHVKLISVRLEIVLILTQDGCAVCTECTIMLVNHYGHTRCTIRLKNHFGHTRWNS